MHTQHVKFSAYVAWGSVVGVAVAVGVVFEEGEVGLDDDVAGSVLEAVVVVVSFCPSPSLLLVFFLVVLLDCIGTTEGLVVCPFFFHFYKFKTSFGSLGTCSAQLSRTQDRETFKKL